jgi:hypothetical protein
VAGERAVTIFIALFGQHDLVDESRKLRIRGWQPGHFNTTEFTLQSLQQPHEIQHSKSMMLHENLKLGLGFDPSVDRMN